MFLTAIRFFLYVRKSTDREDHQVKSIEDQLAVLRALAARLGIVIVAEFTEAKSAKKPHIRPVFADMMRRIERGEAAGILVWHINRLYRNPFDDGWVRQNLQDGIILCIQTPERAYLPEDNALLLAVESGMANQYVRDLKNDVERGVKQKASRGWWPYQPKIGYRVDELTKNVEPKIGDFELLRESWDLMLTGQYSVPQVGEQLRVWGFRCKATKTKKVRSLSRSSLYRMFRDPFYMGEFKYQGRYEQGNHQPMVTAEEFARVQHLLNPNEVRPKSQTLPFTGLIRCAICGCAITAETKVKRYKKTGRTASYTYYHCTGYRGCYRQSVTLDYLEEEIGGFVNSCQVDPDMIDWAIDEIMRLTVREATSGLVDEKHLSLEKRLESRLEAVYEMREGREISAEDFQSRKRRYEAEIEMLHSDRIQTQAIQTERRADVLRKLEVARDLKRRFADGDASEKGAVARAVATKYSLTLGKLEIVPDPLFDRLRTFEPSRSGPDQIGDGPSGPDSSAWRALRDDLLTLIDPNLA